MVEKLFYISVELIYFPGSLYEQLQKGNEVCDIGIAECLERADGSREAVKGTTDGHQDETQDAF